MIASPVNKVPVLVCANCGPCLHRFRERRPMFMPGQNANAAVFVGLPPVAWELLFSCETCGSTRRYGFEESGART